MSRASDDTREQAVAVLRSGLMSGRLGTDTFVGRVDAAYRAKTHDELATVTRDLPRPRRFWHAIHDRLTPPPADLRPPDIEPGERRVLGRARGCDYAIDNPTVSMRHAELIRRDDGWAIRDLASLNGTRVNGWLVAEQALQRGDTVAFGSAVFRFDA